MNEQIEVLLTFILYLAFFGWIGWTRGSRREGFTLAVALGSWILLQEFGDVFVRLANLIGKALAFVRAGGLGANPDAAFAALRSVPPWIDDTNRAGFLFILWVAILILAYMMSGLKPFSKNNKADGWAVLFGMLSGLLYATVLLPRLITLLVPGDVTAAEVLRSSNALKILASTATTLRSALVNVWQLVKPQASLIILLVLTLLLVLAASSLRRGERPRRAEERR
ncbi:MAG: hypothetical protein U0350_27620 [Caldilineaceae bacterium]